MGVRRYGSIAGPVLALSLLGALAAGCDGDTDTDEGITVEVTCDEAEPYGRSWEDWSERWWVWATAIPVDSDPQESPFFDGPCGKDQPDDAFFLAGTMTLGWVDEQYAECWEATRACTVPTDVPIFFPIVNMSAYACGEVNADDCCCLDCPSIQEWFTGWEDWEVTMEVQLDEEELDICSVLDDCFEMEPPESGHSWAYYEDHDFDCAQPWAEGNPCGMTAGTPRLGVGAGYWTVLNPLEAGQHTLHFKGEWAGDPGWWTEVTYNLTVE